MNDIVNSGDNLDVMPLLIQRATPDEIENIIRLIGSSNTTWYFNLVFNLVVYSIFGNNDVDLLQNITIVNLDPLPIVDQTYNLSLVPLLRGHVSVEDDR